jgi:pimeloyl-ACP methyl ester carboxylesterase
VPRICNLISQADAKRKEESDEASKLFLRASAVCHIARFPVLNSTLRTIIWSMQKEAYTAGTSFWKDPVKLIHVPHKHATPDEGSSIPLSYRYPSCKTGFGPVPVILCISGLDGFRIDVPGRCTNYFNSQGWAIVAADIPGSGDCPAAKMDPESPDRLWSSVLDWIAERPELDEHHVCAWGFSTGGYYSLRAAHTHALRLKGVIAQGLFAHHALSPEWIDVMDSGEYASSLTRSLMNKFDYASVDEMKADSQKRFSLVESGILNKPCTKLLMLNGMDDTIYPIEDSMLVLQYGGPKEARFTPGRAHMGEPQAAPIGFEWIKRLFESPQYQLEEAFKLYQEALKLQSQQALAPKEMRANHTRHDSRVSKRVSGIVTKPFAIASLENGPPNAELNHNLDKECGSPTSREPRLLRKIGFAEPTAPQSTFRPLAVMDNGVSTKSNTCNEQVIRGPPASHGAVPVEKAVEASSTLAMPATPPTPAISHKEVIRADSDVDADEHATKMTGNEDRRLSGILNGVEGSLNLTLSNEYKMASHVSGLGITGGRENGSVNKRDSFHEMYEYAPAGIETEVVHAAPARTGSAVKVNGMLTPESPKMEKRLSMMFDRSSRPVSVYRNENSKWEQGHTWLHRAETLAI